MSPCDEMYWYWLILMAGLYVLTMVSCVLIVIGNRIMVWWKGKRP